MELADEKRHFNITPRNLNRLKELKKKHKKKNLNEALEMAFYYYDILHIAIEKFPELTDIMIKANQKRHESDIERLKANMREKIVKK